MYRLRQKARGPGPSTGRLKRSADRAAVEKKSQKKPRLDTDASHNVADDDRQGTLKSQQTKTGAEMMDLPNEMLVDIFKKLPLHNALRLKRVCKRFQAILQTPTFFQKVVLCNAAVCGMRKVSRYITVATNHETLELTLSCATKHCWYELVSATTIDLLKKRCPLLKELTLMNGSVRLPIISRLPASLLTIKFRNVMIRTTRKKPVKHFKDETIFQRPFSELVDLAHSRRLP